MLRRYQQCSRWFSKEVMDTFIEIILKFILNSVINIYWKAHKPLCSNNFNK